MPVLSADLRELAGMVPEGWAELCRNAATELESLRGADIGKFKALISIGFDKNGEVDFRVNMGVAGLNRPDMDDLCRMMPWAIKEALSLWLEHGPPSKENLQGATEPRPAE